MNALRKSTFLTVGVAALLLACSTVAVAGPGGGWGRGGFDYVLVGTDAVDTYAGAAGDRDRLIGKGGADVLSGGDGNDLIRGGADADEIDGGADNDRLFGGSGEDDIDGGDGNDRIFGHADDDTISDGAGRDIIKAGRGDDTINLASDGVRDLVVCGPGEDWVYGVAGEDRIAPNCEHFNILRP